MTPRQWSSRREPNLDPAVEALVRDVLDAVDDLETARIRLDNLDVAASLNEPTEVDEAFMANLARIDQASPALRSYAERVRNGECRWSDIEMLARPLPREVTDLRNSPDFIWRWSTPHPSPPGGRPGNRNPYDDFADEDQSPDSWLD